MDLVIRVGRYRATYLTNTNPGTVPDTELSEYPIRYGTAQQPDREGEAPAEPKILVEQGAAGASPSHGKVVCIYNQWVIIRLS
uniref:Uncharacterized protein n=1 Tax=Candidatus Kentrum sp. DK TaxID=2126562 RepID=A0A450S6U7_9GAMM|nr:MAG: hypothetical protein BECKDK2373B_GA0170837_101750 [Candidatus Kentron sp. DK]